MVDTGPNPKALLTHEQIVAIGLDVIRQHSPALDFGGVMASEGGSGRVEILVTVKGCHAEPCRLLLNLSRSNQVTLERELRRKLTEQLLSHVAEA